MNNILQNTSLKKYNTFGIDVTAAYFSSFRTAEEAKELLAYKLPTNNSQRSTLILGGGSNLLFTKNFNGLVLKNEIGGIEKVKEDAERIYVKAGAGVNWHSFVLHCIENDFAGIENLSLIPGNVGASPMQNIGAYGVEIKDVFHQLEALHIEDGNVVEFNLNDCAFGYRESIFKRKYKGQFIITSVT
ncbi:MAG: FAD-binding protein [Bacteroidota bacterium]